MVNILSNAIKKINRNTRLCGSATALAVLGMSATVYAQEPVEEVLVQGVRAAQASAINTKRSAVSVVDGIVAEDIGKLPDVTISDSLQRIPGVQIQRVAGEGGSVQVRGFNAVATALNGEEFLSATTITTSSADFGDLSSQLFAGADVYKSPVATLSVAGISGTIDLKTRRPFDMDEGFTFSGAAEVDRGSDTRETDPTVNGLINWRNESVGFLLSAVTTKKNLGTDFNGYFDTSQNGGIGATNHNYTWGTGPNSLPQFHVVPQGFAAWSKVEERNRDGINASFQADVGNGFEVVADYFYSEQERFNRKVGLSFNNRWQSFNDFAFATPNGTKYQGIDINDPDPESAIDGLNVISVSEYTAKSYRLQSFTQTNKNTEESENFNLEVNYDNGGALTGQLRFITADASAQHRHGYSEGDLLSISRDIYTLDPANDPNKALVKIPTFVASEHCGPDDVAIGSEGGCFARYGNGITSPFNLIYNVQGDHPVFGGFDQIVDGGLGPMSVAGYMADKSSYHIGAFSSEGNTDSDGELDAFSAKGNYAFEDLPFITSVDVGLRYSERSVTHETFSYFSEFGENSCAAQWKAVDQNTGSGAACQEGEMIPHPQAGEAWEEEDEDGNIVDSGVYPAEMFQGYTMLPPTSIDQHNNAIWVTDFGPVKGVPGMWAADPRDYDDALGFHNRVFGNTQKVITPGESWDVGLEELSSSIQLNFAQGIVSGNLGLRVIDTELTIKQNVVGDAIEHSGSNVDIGDTITSRSYTDYLPALNISVDLTDDVKLRAAASKTMMALDLAQWGGGKSVGRVFNEACGCMRVNGGSLTGNPELDPWRAENYEASVEWYSGTASMLSLGLFKIEIESFTQPGRVYIDEPDLDGVTRGPWPFNATIQGEGGEVDGVEVGAKIAFDDWLDTDILSNVGVDLNYTLSDSSQPSRDINGDYNAFPQNSRHTYNIVGWYENDRLSGRIAYNYRSERLVSIGGAAVGFQNLYQDEYGQVDLSVSYDMTENVSVYINGSNILEEFEDNYLQFKDQKAFQNIYEARWALGVRATY